MSAATIIPDRLRDNPSNFVFLDLLVDTDFDAKSFQDLIFSFRHNYSLRYITLVRTRGETRNGKPIAQRSIKELKVLVKEILRLPRLEMLDFENFTNEEIAEFEGMLRSATRVQ